MGPHLTYRPRESVVFGVVGGRTIELATQPNAAGVHAWRMAAQAGGSAAPRAWEHQHDFRSGKWTTIPGARSAGGHEHALAIGESSALEVYDYPGRYAQRFDGVDPGGANHRPHASVIRMKAPALLGGAVCIHGPPPCGNPRCIVVQQWDSLFDALKTARQLSLVVEL
jgi:hypothetical protein